MKLRFVIDKEYDINITLQMNKNLTRQMLERHYDNVLPQMEIKQKEYQSSWDEIGDTFSEYIEKATGYGWFYPEYACVLSVVLRGVSNWGHEPKIMRTWEQDSHTMRRMAAHELILSHYFEIYRRNYSEEGLKDGQVWALAEIAAFALTSLTKEAQSFWPENAERYTNHNYPQIVDIQNGLKTVFIESMEKKNFDGYVKAGIELVKKYPDMGPWFDFSKIKSP